MMVKVKTLAQGLAKAMSAKSSKKAQTKKAPKSAAKPHDKGHSKPKPKLAKGSKATEMKVGAKAEKIEKTDKKEQLKSGKAPTQGKADSKNDSKTKGKEQALVAAVLAAEKSLAKGKKAAGGSKAAMASAHHERMCRETGCENLATTKGYCRLDYIKNWKKIKRKEMILKEGKLNQYIEELVSKYPDKYIEVIRQDLSTEVNFNKVIHDLELDESIDDLDYDGDSIDSLIGSIRKEDDIDDTDF